jgi:DNA-binding CsgD family transcriptional regulator
VGQTLQYKKRSEFAGKSRETPLLNPSELVHWISKIDKAQTPQEAFDQYCSAVEPYGFDFISMGRLLPPRPGAQAPQNVPRQFHLSKGADDWINKLVSTGDLITKSPLVLHGFRVSVPFRWREAWQNLTEEQKVHVEGTKAAGLNYGICFPIVKDRTAPGLMSMGRKTDFDLSLQDMVSLETLVRQVFDVMYRFTEMPEALPKLTLSQREREVLSLVAQGKTNWEIGTILQISEYSVRDYLKDLSRRMATSNRTHTVTRAIRLGLILP